MRPLSHDIPCEDCDHSAHHFTVCDQDGCQCQAHPSIGLKAVA